jgi:hydrogenase-4 component A
MERFIQVDSDRCIGCGTCLAACSEAHRKAGRQEAPRLTLVKTRDISAAVACHHCVGAPCAKICPVCAINATEQGGVVVDEKRCVGCRLCAVSCPFGAIKMYGTTVAGVAGTAYPTPTFVSSLSPILQWEVGVYAAAVKCDLCSFETDGTKHCIESCLNKALRLVDQSGQDDSVRNKRLVAAAASERILFESLENEGGES